MSLNNKFLGLLAVLLVTGCFILLTPSNVYAGATGLGCCINNSGNCVKCGTDQAFCQTTQNGSCPDVLTDPADCADTDIVPSAQEGCFVPGAVCFQEDVNSGICSEAPTTPPPGGCMEDADCNDNDICTTDTCNISNGVCQFTFDENNDPSCVPPLGGVVVPTLNQWGIIIAVLLIGFFAVVMLRRSKDSEI